MISSDEHVVRDDAGSRSAVVAAFVGIAILGMIVGGALASAVAWFAG